MAKVKGAFLDGDGVMNEPIHHAELGVIDSPSPKAEFRIIAGVSGAITRLHKMGHKAILVSNQPGMAKGNLPDETFEEIGNTERDALAKGKAFLDGEYYRLHDPEGKTERLRRIGAAASPSRDCGQRYGDRFVALLGDT